MTFFLDKLSNFYLCRVLLIPFYFYSQWNRLRFKQCGSGFLLKGKARILGARYITMGKNFTSGDRLRLEVFNRHNGRHFQPTFSVGNGVSINDDCHIGCINKIEIGNNVLIASKVFISDHAHGALDFSDIEIYPSLRELYSKGPIIIEDNVWICEGVVILPNVVIGKGSIIGANAVVTRNIPPYSIAVGAPARVIKSLM